MTIPSTNYNNVDVKDLALKAGLSFVISTLAVSLFSGHLVAGALVGTLAAAATCIAELVKPVFRSFWGDPIAENWVQRNLRRTTAIALTSLAAAPLLSVSISAIGAIALGVAVDAFTTQFKDTPWTESGYTVMV